MRSSALRATLFAVLAFPALPLLADDLSPSAAVVAPVIPGVAGIDLVKLLAPPPAAGSPMEKDELAQILAIQKKRTKEQEARAQADQDYSVFRFADAVGPGFEAASLPKTSAYFDKVIAAAKGVAEGAKDHWGRLRPFLVDGRIHPCDKPSQSASYPSGHATAGTAMAIVLADLLPEKRDAILARGWQFAWNRVIGGVHYPSDVEAGRIAGTLVAQAILEDPGMQAEAKAAREELAELK